MSASPNSDWPPKRVEPISTWSFLKSVGLSSTRTPLPRVSSVTPMALFNFSEAMLPPAGGPSISLLARTFSVRGSMVCCSAFATASSNCCCVGTLAPAFGSAPMKTTSFFCWSGITLATVSLISCRVTCGKSSCAYSNSLAMPGMASCSRKLREYSATKPAESDLSRSLYARS